MACTIASTSTAMLGESTRRSTNQASDRSAQWSVFELRCVNASHSVNAGKSVELYVRRDGHAVETISIMLLMRFEDAFKCGALASE